MRLPDPVRRALRTFVQDFIRTFLLLVSAPNLIQAAVTEGDGIAQRVPDPSTLVVALIAAAWAGSLAVLTFILNALEDSTGVPVSIVPKAEPAPPAAGQRRDAQGRFAAGGYSVVEVLLIVFLALLVVWVAVRLLGPAL